jgi:hypothetical protein
VRLLNLSSQEGGEVLATVKLTSGQSVRVTFTTSSTDGITVANPDQDIFDQEPMSAAEVRSIIAAVVAFHRVAAHSQGTA